MSLAINVERVVAVLLSDGWHDVAPLSSNDTRTSFIIDAYEFVTAQPGYDERSVWHNDDPGFAFAEADGRHWIVGPLAAILAVKYRGYEA